MTAAHRLPDPPLRPPPFWILHAVAWIGLAATYAPALRHRPLGLPVVAAALWAAGLVSLAVPRAWGLLVFRLGGVALLLGGVALVAAAPGLLSLDAGAAGVYTLSLAMTRSVGDRMIDGASYPGERRFAFRAPRAALAGIVIACVLPCLTTAGVVAAIAGRGPVRWAGVAVAVVTVVPSAVLARRLDVLARRMLVFAPRAVAVVDPFFLADAISIPLARILDVGVAAADTAAPAELLDLRCGARGRWLQMLFDAVLEVPHARNVPKGLERFRLALPPEALGIAWPLSLPELCKATAAAVGLPVDGEALDHHG